MGPLASGETFSAALLAVDVLLWLILMGLVAAF
jgi:hypothetical protein